jgi:hypothetical protein
MAKGIGSGMREDVGAEDEHQTTGEALLMLFYFLKLAEVPVRCTGRRPSVGTVVFH